MKITSQKTFTTRVFVSTELKMRWNVNILIDINAVLFQHYIPKKSWKLVDGCGEKLDFCE